MGKKTDINTDALIIKKYCFDKLGSVIISRDLGISKSLVLDVLNRYNIKKRSYSQASKQYFMNGGKHGMSNKKHKKESINKMRESYVKKEPWTKGLTRESSEKLNNSIEKGILTRNPKYISYDSTNGYMKILINGKYKMLHRHIWELAYGKISKDYVIHHIDGDKLNNNIQNLELIGRKEHTKLHHINGDIHKEVKKIESKL